VKNSNFVLDIAGGSTVDKSKIEVWTKVPIGSQKWTFTPIP